MPWSCCSAGKGCSALLDAQNPDGLGICGPKHQPAEERVLLSLEGLGDQFGDEGFSFPVTMRYVLGLM